MRRRLWIAGALALAAGIAVGIAIGTDDVDDNEPPRRTATGPRATVEGPGPEPRETSPRPAPRRTGRGDVRAVRATVTKLVEAAERGDGARFCRLVGRQGSTLQACSQAVGIDPFALPTSDELSIDSVAIDGDRATARHVDGRKFRLRRRGGRWIVVGG